MSERQKYVRVAVCYTAMEVFYLPIEAKTYNPDKEEQWNEGDSIASYLCDHRCEPIKDIIVNEIAETVLEQIPETDRLFSQYFDGLCFKDYLDPLISAAIQLPIIDICKFEKYLHQAHEDYGKDGLDLLEFIAIQYGNEAAAFFEELLL
ncbi:hypothetical protein FACS1894172_02830 [Spirochaetia bacterium]|nr:hypothetical protein FACS1894164_20110 [Spirochaetia bacterium]GHU30169.1 hypothetical protein FACS1894172_02830 [Spirochaetia bacterium]